MKAVIASGIRVYCRHDAIEATAKLKPNPSNPNTHPATQIKKLVAVIKANGWRMPITVSTRSGMITKGHGRLLAAQEADWTEVPVERQAYATEAQEWADVIADNALPELSTTDEQLMAAALKKLRASELDFSASTGYDEAEFDKLLARLQGNPEASKGRTTDPTPPAQQEDRKTVILHYTRAEHEEFEKLSGEAMKALELLTVSDTMFRLITEAAK